MFGLVQRGGGMWSPCDFKIGEWLMALVESALGGSARGDWVEKDMRVAFTQVHVSSVFCALNASRVPPAVFVYAAWRGRARRHESPPRECDAMLRLVRGRRANAGHGGRWLVARRVQSDGRGEC